MTVGRQFWLDSLWPELANRVRFLDPQKTPRPKHRFAALYESVWGKADIMTTVLIVDDSIVDRKLAGGCLKNCDLEVAFACDGREALELMADEPPDLVITDLQMPEVDGLELVKQMRKRHRRIPVILMTAHGNEETAVTALKLGASSYVPKKNLSRDLKDTVLSILSIASSERAEQQILESLTSVRMEFTLGNDIAAL